MTQTHWRELYAVTYVKQSHRRSPFTSPLSYFGVPPQAGQQQVADRGELARQAVVELEEQLVVRGELGDPFVAGRSSSPRRTAPS